MPFHSKTYKTLRTTLNEKKVRENYLSLRFIVGVGKVVVEGVSFEQTIHKTGMGIECKQKGFQEKPGLEHWSPLRVPKQSNHVLLYYG